MNPMTWLARRRCQKYGHDWFPMLAPREFIPVSITCLRCREEEVMLPWGQCLTAHPIAEHYTADGELLPVSIDLLGNECHGPF